MPPSKNIPSRLESVAFYVFLAVAALSPLAFWPSQYVALDSVKTLIIGLGTLVPAVLILILAVRERSLSLPSRSLVWTGLLIAVSTVVSAIWSGHFIKSFFGQGFEVSAGGFILVLMLAGLVAHSLVVKKPERAIILYAGLMAAFLVLYVFHALRFVFPSMTLGILSVAASTVAGNWYSLAMLAVVMAVLAVSALRFLPLSSRMKAAYWILIALSFSLAYIVNSLRVWQAACVVFLIMTVGLSLGAFKRSNRSPEPAPVLKRIAWLPLIVCAVAGIFAWKGVNLAGPAITKLNASYTELSLPWQTTLDVTAGELKSSPLFGTGPNRFSQAYLSNKPAGINQTDYWGVEFNSGFGLIPTFFATEGLVGGALWLLFLVFFAILGVRSLRGILGGSEGDGRSGPDQPYARFVLVSSYASAAFLWILSLIYVPSHMILFLTAAMTGIWLGAASAYGRLRPFELSSSGRDGKERRSLRVAAYVLVVVFAVWGAVFLKNAVALAYFGAAVKALNVSSDPVTADADFGKAIALNPMDVFWQGRAEAAMAEVNNAVSSVTSSTDASTSAAIAATATADLNKALGYAANAIASDPDNYYNYISEARVASLAASLKMTNAYGTAVAAYGKAISLNPGNPSIYLDLARLEASESQYDQAIQAVGASLQVKSNYLDGVFLLSQLEAAKGNLSDAVTAAQFATTLNPGNPLLFFQLGLLEYTKGDYASAEKSFTQAIAVQNDYANAAYFLGLTEARLGKYAQAISIFQQLHASNPDSSEVSAILSTLQASKPLFTGAAAKAASPEKQANPPLPEKK